MILNSPTISGSLTVTGNILTSGSITLSGSVASASFASTASFVALAQSASNAVAAATASSADNLLVRNTLTAQTLVVQTITSSVNFVTGSTRFGSVIGNTHVFTGSMAVSGGVNFRTAQNFIVSSSSTGWVSGFINDYNNAVYIGVDNDGMYMQPTSKGTKLVAGNGTTYLYVTSSGVGIGTTNPLGPLHIGSALTNSGDAAAIILKQTSTTAATGIYLERSGEQKGYYMYVGGSTDSLTFRRNNAGTKSDVLWLTREGHIHFVGRTAFDSPVELMMNCNYDNGNDIVTETGYTARIEFLKSDGVLRFQTGATGASYTAGAGANNSDRMVILPDGKVGIGTVSPGKTLQVAASVAGEVVQFNNTRNSAGDYVMVTTLGASANSTSAYHYIAATGGADRYYLFGNGTYQTVSDIRLKKNITTVTDTYLDKVNALRIVNYNWNDQQDGSELELGMIAQEVEEIIPSIVYEGREHEDGSIYKGIQVSSLPYILIKAIQELKAQNDSLQQQINELKAQ